MYAIGVDLGGTNLRVGLVSSTGEILELMEEKTPHGPGAPQAFVDFIIQSTKVLMDKFPDKTVSALGVGSPGPICRKRGNIQDTPNLPDYDSFPVIQKLNENLSVPCFIDNDANCAAFAEWKLGAAKNYDHFVMLTLGTGIGGAIVTHGQMIYGKSDGAGELGHITLYPNGLLCKCGKLGCYEQYASATAIKRRATEVYGEEVSNKDLFDNALSGEERSLKILNEVAVDLSIGMGSLINALEPQAFVFGGGIFKSGGEPLLGFIKENLKNKAFASSLEGLEVLPAHFKSNSGVIGAATMALSEGSFF